MGNLKNVKHPSQFNAAVVNRFLSGKSLEEFQGVYDSAKRIGKKFSVYKADIVKRGLGDAGFDAFCSQYMDSRHRQTGRNIMMPNQDDRRIVDAMKRLKSYTEVRKIFPGMSYQRIQTAMTRVTAWSE